MSVGSAVPVWDVHDVPGFPALDHNVTADACVVGLGGSGLAAISQLLGHGLSVVGLDVDRVGAGAAGRNAGFLLAGGAPFHHDAVRLWGHEAAMQVHSGTVDEMRRMTELMPELVATTGSLRIAADAAELEDCQLQFEQMGRDSLPVERYSGAEGEGLLFPEDAVFQPLEWCRREACMLATAGARLHERSAAVSIEPGMVVANGFEIRARLVIVAVDGLLHRVIPSLADRVRPVRLQMLATKPTSEVRLPLPVYQNFGYNYWRQLDDGRVVLGGSRDRHLDESETASELTTDAIQHDLERLLRDVVGVCTAAITHRWAGVVGYTADERPVIEQVEPGVWAVGGYSGTGNLVGRRAARGVVELALTGRSELLAGLRP